MGDESGGKDDPRCGPGDGAGVWAGAEGQARWRLLAGDCRALLPELPAGSLDAVVTSPPYFWQRDYRTPGQTGLEPTIDAYVATLVGIFRGVRRALSPRGTVLLNLGDTYYSAKGEPAGGDPKQRSRRFGLRAVDGPGLGLPRKSLIGIPWRVALALAADGWTLRSAVVWHRAGAMPEPSARDRPWRRHEFVFLLSQGPRYYFDRAGLCGEEDVWSIPTGRRGAGTPGGGGAPYPAALAARCVAVGCPPGGTVLDPFCGSGTTLLAALDAGRSAVGMEIDADACAALAARLRARGHPASRPGRAGPG